MNPATEQKLERIVEALVTAVSPDGEQVKDALSRLLAWKPEDAPRPLKGYGITAAEMRAVPFMCETYLYGLLGKEDARSLLSRVRNVCKAVGLDMNELQGRE